MPHNFRLILFLVLLAVLLGVSFYYWPSFHTNTPAAINLPFGSPTPQPSRVCFNGSCFLVELARTPAEQERGLMYRQSLTADRGMLFIFANAGVYSFWMKNTFIPLDIIWLDQNGRVVFIRPNAQPCPAEGDCSSIDPGVSAKYVLEINAKLADKMELEVGDAMEISI